MQTYISMETDRHLADEEVQAVRKILTLRPDPDLKVGYERDFTVTNTYIWFDAGDELEPKEFKEILVRFPDVTFSCEYEYCGDDPDRTLGWIGPKKEEKELEYRRCELLDLQDVIRNLEQRIAAKEAR